LFDGSGPLFTVRSMKAPQNADRPFDLSYLLFSPARFRKSIGVLVALVWLCGRLPIQAVESPDEAYLRIYFVMEQADNLQAQGKTDAAHAKYLDVQKELLAFQRDNPTWRPRVINYRLGYVAGRLTPPTAAPAPTEASAPAATTTAPAKPVATPRAAEFKLLAAGAEPRQALRLHPKAGDQQTMNMTIKMAMTMAAQGVPTPEVKMPPMRMVMDVLVKDVSAAGDIAYEATFSDAGAVEEAGASPQMNEAINTALAQIKGLSVSGVTTERGVTKDVNFKLPAGANPQLRQVMDQTKTAMSQVSLPEEPVGVGGKWEVKRKVKTQGLNVDQTETYEITALDGDQVTLNTTVTQHAANQKMQNPAMPGLNVDIGKMETKGTGTTTLNLSRLMPASAAVDGHTEMAMSMNAGGKKQSMEMNMDMTMKFESK
jgi:hypothetical protein